MNKDKTTKNNSQETQFTWGNRGTYPTDQTDKGFRLQNVPVSGGKQIKSTRGDDLKYFASQIIGIYGEKWGCDWLPGEEGMSLFASNILLFRYNFWYINPETGKRHEFELRSLIRLPQKDIELKFVLQGQHTYAIKRGLELIGFARNVQIAQNNGDYDEFEMIIKAQEKKPAKPLEFSKLLMNLKSEEYGLEVKKGWYKGILARCVSDAQKASVEKMFKEHVFDVIDDIGNTQLLMGNEQPQE